MNKRKELKILKSVISASERDSLPFIYKPLVQFFLFLAFGALFLLSKNLYESQLINIYIFSGILMFSGVAIAVYAMSESSYEAWFKLRFYLDSDAIKKRVSELET